MFQPALICLWTSAATSATIALLDATDGIAGDARGIVIGTAGATFVGAIIMHAARVILSFAAENRRQTVEVRGEVAALRDWVEASMHLDAASRPPTPEPEPREPAPVVPIRMSRRGHPAIAGIRHGAIVDESGIWAAIDRTQHGDAS